MAASKFADLTTQEQERTIAKYRDNMEFFSEFITDDIRNAGEMIFNDLIKIYWSGFGHQCDGMSIAGDLDFKPGSVEAIKAEYPKDETIQIIALDWQNAQRKYFYQLRAECRSTNRNNTISNIIDRRDYRIEVSREVEKEMDSIIDDFCRWGFNLIRQEWEYQSSDAAIRELLMAE